MRKWLMVASIAGLAAAPVLAQQRTGDDRPPTMHGPTTRAEAMEVVRTQFARIDSNGDGTISRDEFDAARAAMRGRGDGGPPPPPLESNGAEPESPPPGMNMGMMGGHWFDRVDTDHDGRVTLAEAQSAAMTLFDMIDTDHDGTISPDERHAAREMMRMMHPGRGE